MRLPALLCAFLAAFFATALHAQLVDPASVLPQLNPENVARQVGESFNRLGAGGAKLVLRLQAADGIKAAAGL
jgi:hypothetical protein